MSCISILSNLIFTCLLANVVQVQDAVEALKRADQALVKGDLDAAIPLYDLAIQLDSNFAWPYHGRGVAFFHKKEYEKAIASYSEAIRLDPHNDIAVFDRGLAHWERAEAKKAIADFEAAIKLNPKNDSAYNGLAWALSTASDAGVRDGAKAVALATKACELTTWKNPLHLSALAASYAEAGDFPKAIEWHQKAMASSDFPADKLDRAQQRLKLYEQGKPYRELKK